MNTHQKVWIDKFAGMPLLLLVSVWYRIDKFLITRQKTKPVSSIVVCKLLGMGSIVQSTPLLIALKKSFPEAKITYFTSIRNKPVLEEISCVDKKIYLDDKNIFSLITSQFKILNHFWRNRPGLYFDLEVYSWFCAAIAGLSFSRRRYGLTNSGGTLRKSVYTKSIPLGQYPVLSDAYQALALLAGAGKTHASLFDFLPDYTANNSKISSPFILVNPNASDLRLERRWPSGDFVLLIRSLLDHFPQHSIVLSGSASEAAYVQSIIHDIRSENPERIKDTSGKLSLKQFIGLISESDLMVTNDSGPMHLALAVKKPVVALFGPGSPSQYLFPENVKIIYKKIHCSPCVHLHPTSPCNGDNQCMKQITVQEVFDACLVAMPAPSEELQC